MKNRTRFITLFAILFFAISIRAQAPLPVPAAQTGGDTEAKLEQLQKEMQKYADQGKPPPPALLEKLQKLMDEAQGIEAKEPPPRKTASWVAVPYTGTVRITNRCDATVRSGDATIAVKEEKGMEAQITGTRPEKDDDNAIVNYIPQGTVITRVDGNQRFEAVSESGKVVHTFETVGSDRREFGKGVKQEMSLELDPVRKKYLIKFPNGWVDAAKITETLTGPGFSERKTSTKSVRVERMSEKYPEDTHEYPYTPGTAVLTHSYSVPAYTMITNAAYTTGSYMREGSSDLEMFRRGGGSNLLAPVMVTVSWNLRLKGSDLRALFEPEPAYDTWLPDGGLLGAGSMIKIKVRITEPKGAKGRITFRLRDVSTEKGWCLNYPGTADTKPDLRFNKNFGSKGIWTSADYLEARTEEEVNEAVVAVQSLDYGAWGKLEAEVKVLVKGEEQTARAVYEKMGTDWLAVPRDDNNNSIADAWEKSMRVQNVAGDADDDNDPVSATPGDGFSAYEEYRGVFIRGKHTRLDPKKKDLFIYDPDGLAENSSLKQVTRLDVHYIDVAEFRLKGSPERAVNHYKGRHHVVDQSAIWVHKGKNIRGGWGVAGPGYGKNGPPRSAIPWVIIDADRVRSSLTSFSQRHSAQIKTRLGFKGLTPDQAWLEGHIATAIKWITVHETCHAISINHHDQSPYYANPAGSGTSQGQWSCVMRYLSQEDGGDGSVDELMEILCGASPWPNSMCTTMHHCRKQIVVTDKGD